MRWISYFILTYVVVAMQIALKDYVAIFGASPNLVLLAVVFIALHAPRDAALLGAFMLGLAQDFLGLHPPGLYAFSYGVVGMLVVGLQQVVHREHPVSHFAATLLGGIIVAVVVSLHGWIHPAMSASIENGIPLAAVRDGVGSLFLSAVYTAMLAPPALWLLGRTRPLFAFPNRRPRAWG